MDVMAKQTWQGNATGDVIITIHHRYNLIYLYMIGVIEFVYAYCVCARVYCKIIFPTELRKINCYPMGIISAC